MDIRYYRELLVEWCKHINEVNEERHISSLHLGVLESHLIRKINNEKGVLLCANYPDYKRLGSEDNYASEYSCVIYIVEKVPSGSMKDEQELMHYAEIEKMMRILVLFLEKNTWCCPPCTLRAKQLKVEWEYDVFGGFNGQSLSFKLEEFSDD